MIVTSMRMLLTWSTSPKLTPVAFIIACIAGTGPIPMIVGSHPAAPYPTIRARGVRFSLHTTV